MAKKSLEIDMIAGSQLRDTQGEMLSVEGADISELLAGRGRLNDNHGKGFFNSIGSVTQAKKIFKKEDCEDDRHAYYWDKVKAPFIYVRGYLYDDEEHPNAKAAAAILRNIHKNDSPLQLKASVEGGVVSRGVSDPTLLARTKIHSVALTFTPANNNTLVEPISLDKSASSEDDLILIKSVLHLAQSDVPSFRHIVRDAAAEKIKENLQKIIDMSSKVGLDHKIPSVSKHDILHKAIEEKIKQNVFLIHETIIGEPLDKGIKDIGMAAAMGAALAASPAQGAPAVKPVAQQMQVASSVSRNNDHAPHQQMYEKIKKQYPILGGIGAIESSGGLKHDDHTTITKKGDPNYGHTAGGIWAMMPRQAAFIVSKDTKLATKYPSLAEAAKKVNSEDFNHLAFTNTFNTDPQAAADFAVSAFLRNKAKTKNSDMLIASWIKGLKGAWNAYKKKGANAFSEHEYTQKVKSAINPPKKEEKIVSKALMAGYGAAGAPTSRTGGAVLQSEAPRKSLKYIVCDGCGKEQVLAKYQVKCRHCNNNFSLKKLHDILS